MVQTNTDTHTRTHANMYTHTYTHIHPFVVADDVGEGKDCTSLYQERSVERTQAFA